MMKRFFCASLLVSCAVAAGCSSSDNGSSAPSGSDAGSNDGSATSNIAIDPTHAQYAVSEDTTFTGNGANDLGAIAISGGVGTIQFKNETANAFFFNATGVPTGTVDGGDLDGGEFAADRDFEIIAVQETRFIVAFITCTGPKLTFIFYESTDGVASGKELPATGSCAILEQNTTETITLPAVAIPPPAVVSGFSITGAQISFDGTHVGSTTFQGNSYALYPFNVVDCTACATPGWYELHSLLWDEKNKNACLGILYLEQNAPSTVGLAYAMCLPTVTPMFTDQQLGFSATWTSP